TRISAEDSGCTAVQEREKQCLLSLLSESSPGKSVLKDLHQPMRFHTSSATTKTPGGGRALLSFAGLSISLFASVQSSAFFFVINMKSRKNSSFHLRIRCSLYGESSGTLPTILVFRKSTSSSMP